MIRNLFIICFLILLGFLACDREEDLIEDNTLKLGIVENHIKNAKDKNLSVNDRSKKLELAYATAATLGDDEGKIRTIREISSEYYRLNDLENFKRFNNKVLDLATEQGDSLNIAKSYFMNGLYFRSTDLINAYSNFYQAEKVYLSLDQKKIIDPKIYAYDYGKVLIDIAQILQKFKDYSESEYFTVRAIEKFELSGRDKYLPICYTNLGILASALGRHEAAVQYYLKSIESSKGSKKVTFQTVVSYNNIGIVYKTIGDYEKSEEYFNKGLAFKDFLDKNPGRYARLLDNLAYSKFLSGKNNNEIKELFLTSLSIRDSIGDINGIATNCLHLAEYHKSVGEDEISKNYAERAKNASIKVKNNEELLISYKLLSEVSPVENGLRYMKDYIKLNDSLVKDERSFNNKFARIKFETDQIAEENLQISRENEILVVAVLGLTALFLLVYIIFRQQQSNKELLFAQQQQETNQEIYRLLLNQQVKLEEGRQMEQQRMSEELHDGVLGRLFGVRLSLDGINQRANDGFTEARTKYIEELKSIEKEIRLISHDLGTETLSPEVAYIDAVESLISDLCDAHKMEFEFRNDENIDWETIDDQKKVNLFRILQESLQNIFKHAKAEMIKISFDFVDDNINLLILDDGIGFKSTKVKRGIGLKNITSRVSQMSGVVDFISNKEAGTTVSVSVPLT